MGEPRSEIKVPSVAQIIEINFQMIETKGGMFRRPDNLRYRQSLDWVLGAIQHPVLFGEDPYPSLFEKAAVITWTIITRHVFVDGNKRTGMAAAQVFLYLNDYFMFVTDAEMQSMALRIVMHRDSGFERRDLVSWIYYHAAPKDDLWAHYP